MSLCLMVRSGAIRSGMALAPQDRTPHRFDALPAAL